MYAQKSDNLAIEAAAVPSKVPGRIVCTAIAILKYSPGTQHTGQEECADTSRNALSVPHHVRENSKLLALEPGDNVYVVEMHPSGWWDAIVMRPNAAPVSRGWVPSNYLRVMSYAAPVEQNDAAPPPIAQPLRENPKGNARTKAKNAWKHRSLYGCVNYYFNPITNRTSWCAPDTSDFTAPDVNQNGLELNRIPDRSALELRVPSPKSPGFSPSIDQQSALCDQTPLNLAKFFPDIQNNNNNNSSEKNKIVTWDTLVIQIVRAVTQMARYAQKNTTMINKLKEVVEPVFTAVLNLLNQSGATSKACAEALEPASWRLQTAVSKLSISAVIAGGLWPPPNAWRALRHCGVQVLMATLNFVEVAKMCSLVPDQQPQTCLSNTSRYILNSVTTTTSSIMRDNDLISCLDAEYSGICTKIDEVMQQGTNTDAGSSNSLLCLVQNCVSATGQFLSLLEELRIPRPPPITPLTSDEKVNLFPPDLGGEESINTQAQETWEPPKFAIPSTPPELPPISIPVLTLFDGLDPSEAAIGKVRASKRQILGDKNNPKSFGDIESVQDCDKSESQLGDLLASFHQKKNLLYVAANDLITSARSATGAFAPPDALSLVSSSAQKLRITLEDLLVSTKLFIDHRMACERLVLERQIQAHRMSLRAGFDMSEDPTGTASTEPAIQRTQSNAELSNLMQRSTALSRLTTNLLARNASFNGTGLSASHKSPATTEITSRRLSLIPPSALPQSESPGSAANCGIVSASLLCSNVSSGTSVQSTLPEKYLSYNYTADEIAISTDGEGKVVGGTLPALVERLTLHDKVIHPNFFSTFLTMFRFFATPSDFLNQLFQRFNMLMPGGLTLEQQKTWNQKKLNPVRLRVVNALRSWLTGYFDHKADYRVLEDIEDFVRADVIEVFPTHGKRILEIVNGLKSKENQECGSTSPEKPNHVRNVCSTKLSPETPLNNYALFATFLAEAKEQLHEKHSSFKKGENAEAASKAKTTTLLDFSTSEVAQQMTALESRLYSRIGTPDFIKFLEPRPGEATLARVPNLRVLVQFSTAVSTVVSQSILAEEDVKKCTDAMKFWIKVANECRSLQNYDCLRAIVASLLSSNVKKLAKPWTNLSAKYKKILAELQEISDFAQNFAVYRSCIRNAVTPCIPFLGLYLTDLTFIFDGNKEKRGRNGNLINFERYSRAYNTIFNALRFKEPYKIKEDSKVFSSVIHSLESVLSHVNCASGH